MCEPQNRCAICDIPITSENDSREHIIPNALGGRRTVTGFICASCNSTTGHSWDAVLARQLNPFCLFFHITRQDGEPPAQVFPTIDGGTIRVTYDALELPKPTINFTSHPAGTQIQATARTMAEAREILTGLKRKYPQIDIDAALASATSTYSYLNAPIRMDIQIGGPDAGRSIVKSAFALAVANRVSPSECDEARRYFASGEDACFGYFNEFDVIEGRPPNTVIHCAAVSSTAEGLLLGYVELFSAFRMVICLSSNYHGKPVNAVYAINPVTGAELDLAVRLNFSRLDLKEIYAYLRVFDGSVPQALHEIIPDAMKRQFEREKTRVIERAVKDSWRNLGLEPGTELTREHIMKLSGLIVEQMLPFLQRNAQRQRNAPQQGISSVPEDDTQKET